MIENQTQCALFDERLAQTVLRDTQIIFLTCTRSVWFCSFAFFETEKNHMEYLARGHKVRPIRFIEIKDANHFVSSLFIYPCCLDLLTAYHCVKVHWDEPERFFAVIADVIHNRK